MLARLSRHQRAAALARAWPGRTCWMRPCLGVSGRAAAQISQPGREGLLMKVHEGHAHSI